MYQLYSYSDNAICECMSHVYEEYTRRCNERLDPDQRQRLEEQQKIWQELEEEFGVPCVYLGPEDFYSSPYCKVCLERIINKL